MAPPPWRLTDPAIFWDRKLDSFSIIEQIVAQNVAIIKVAAGERDDNSVELSSMLYESVPDLIFSIFDFVPPFVKLAKTSKINIGWLKDSEQALRRDSLLSRRIIYAFDYLCQTEFPYVVRLPCLDMDEFRSRMIAANRIAVRVCHDEYVMVHCKDQPDAVMVRLFWQLPEGTTL